jgi:hypothetical protein
VSVTTDQASNAFDIEVHQFCQTGPDGSAWSFRADVVQFRGGQVFSVSTASYSDYDQGMQELANKIYNWFHLGWN